MRTWAVRAAVFGLVTAPGALSAQDPVDEPLFRFGAAELQLGGRAQMHFTTTTAEDAEDSEFSLRRVRLEAKVKVNDVVSGKIQPDFANNRVSLKDVYLQLNLAPSFQVLAGKAHKPFSRLEQTSSVRILPIERGARIRGVPAVDQYELINDLDYSDRDIGIQVLGAPAGAPLGLTYAVGAFAGPLQGQIGSSDATQFAARATVSPLEELEIGAGWSSREFTATDALALVELERGHAWELDFEWGGFNPGLHVLGELALGDANPFLDRGFSGAQVWLGWRTGRVSETISTLEPIFRASYGGLEDDELGIGGTLLTPGVNIYLGGWNRIALNYDVWLPEEGDTEGSFKAQFQLHF